MDDREPVTAPPAGDPSGRAEAVWGFVRDVAATGKTAMRAVESGGQRLRARGFRFAWVLGIAVASCLSVLAGVLLYLGALYEVLSEPLGRMGAASIVGGIAILIGLLGLAGSRSLLR